MGPLTSDPDRSVTTPAILLIPDINGFTQFVRATKVAHSRQIIEELLEKLIDANEIGLQVSEIEGDAILFYRLGPPPTANFQRVVRVFGFTALTIGLTLVVLIVYAMIFAYR